MSWFHKDRGPCQLDRNGLHVDLITKRVALESVGELIAPWDLGFNRKYGCSDIPSRRDWKEGPSIQVSWRGFSP